MEIIIILPEGPYIVKLQVLFFWCTLKTKAYCKIRFIISDSSILTFRLILRKMQTHTHTQIHKHTHTCANQACVGLTAVLALLLMECHVSH